MKNKYNSELLGSLHETAVGLHKIGVIDNEEMLEYDRDCLSEKSKIAHKDDSHAKMEVNHKTA